MGSGRRLSFLPLASSSGAAPPSTPSHLQCIDRAPCPPSLSLSLSLSPPILHTFGRADLGHERADVPNREPVHQAVPPHQRVLVDDARHPGLAQGGQGAWAARGGQAVAVIPGRGRGGRERRSEVRQGEARVASGGRGGRRRWGRRLLFCPSQFPPGHTTRCRPSCPGRTQRHPGHHPSAWGGSSAGAGAG